MGSGHSVQSRRVAVLGGTGFVGRPLCQTLAALGHEVVAVARRRPAGPGPFGERPIRVATFDLATAPARDLADLLTAGRVDTVVNAAGGMWGLTPEQMVAANVTLTERAIAATAALPARRRFIQVGSVHEYGLAPIGVDFREDSGPAPVTEYGKLKLRCSEMVADATLRGEIDGVTLRVGNVVGAGQPTVSLLGVVAAQLRQARDDRRVASIQTAPLDSRRDFITLSDAIDAIVTAVAVGTSPGTLFNIGTGTATSARTMVQSLISVSGVPAELVEQARTGPEESMWQRMCVERAKRSLGWSPNRDLAAGLRALWEEASVVSER